MNGVEATKRPLTLRVKGRLRDKATEGSPIGAAATSPGRQPFTQSVKGEPWEEGATTCHQPRGGGRKGGILSPLRGLGSGWGPRTPGLRTALPSIVPSGLLARAISPSLAVQYSLCAVPTLHASLAAADYEAKWHTIDGGGVMKANGGVYEVSSTIGQHDAGKLTGGVYTVSGGFWVMGPAPPPTKPDGEAVYDKNRYISMVPGNPGLQTALRVTLTSLPSEFSIYEGTQVWVGEPVEICENSGQSTPPPEGCGPAWVPGGPALTMWSANLQATQYCQDFGSVGLLHVTDCEIVPGAIYTVQAIDCTCDPGNEASYSDPLLISTSPWGNICGPWDVDHWSPPDTSVDVTVDVTACLEKFKNAFGAPIKARADVDPNTVDWKVNISTDVTQILDAFKGQLYPFAGPGTCPP